jgi:hypothetical protein
VLRWQSRGSSTGCRIDASSFSGPFIRVEIGLISISWSAAISNPNGHEQHPDLRWYSPLGITAVHQAWYDDDQAALETGCAEFSVLANGQRLCLSAGMLSRAGPLFRPHINTIRASPDRAPFGHAGLS